MRDAYSAAVGHNASKVSFGAQRSSYIAGTKVNLVIGTWNLGDLAAGGDLTAWLRPGADLYTRWAAKKVGAEPRVRTLSRFTISRVHVTLRRIAARARPCPCSVSVARVVGR